VVEVTCVEEREEEREEEVETGERGEIQVP
jgi:hypothetical protein